MSGTSVKSGNRTAALKRDYAVYFCARVCLCVKYEHCTQCVFVCDRKAHRHRRAPVVHINMCLECSWKNVCRFTYNQYVSFRCVATTVVVRIMRDTNNGAIVMRAHMHHFIINCAHRTCVSSCCFALHIRFSVRDICACGCLCVDGHTENIEWVCAARL